MPLVDFLLDVFHIAIIVINTSFWAFRKTRNLFLIVFSFTIFSWLALGYFWGWGYCFLTDIHWDIKRDLGATNLPYSYITYLFHRFFLWYPNPKSVDLGVAIVFISLFIIYGVVLWKVWRAKRSSVSVQK